jgi:hypothetical protein
MRMASWRHCLAVCAVLVTAAPARAAIPLVPVAIRGDAAPGLTGASLQFFSAPMINQQGDVAFVSSLDGAGDADFALWAGRRNDLDLVVREGDVAPGMAGVHFNTNSGFELFSLANNRSPLFRGYLDLNDAGVTLNNDEGLWAGPSGGVGAVMRENAPTAYLPYAMQSAGGGITYSTDDAFFGAAGNVQALGLVGMPAPGGGDDQFRATHVTGVNSGGQLALYGYLADPEQPSALSGRGLWLADANEVGALEAIAVEGLFGDEGETPADLAPGTAGRFLELGQPVLNNRRAVAFSATTDDSAAAAGVWAGVPGQLRMIARVGGPAPLPGGQHTIANFLAHENGYAPAMLINGRDEACFVATLAGPDITAANDRAILIGDSATTLRVLAREGDPAPGAAAGVTFAKFAHHVDHPFTSPVLNAAGQAAFSAVLTGPGVTESNDIGLFATDVLGQIHLIAREGQAVELEPGLAGTIEFTPESGGEEGRGFGFNDVGQLAFSVMLKNATIADRNHAIVLAQVPVLNADFTGDGVVDQADALRWSEHAGLTTGALRTDGDADGDEDVDGMDFLVWQRRVVVGGGLAPAGQYVPEPAGMMMVALELAVVISASRRRQTR